MLFWSLTCVNSLLDGNESHRQSVLDVNQLHVHKDVAQMTLEEPKQKGIKVRKCNLTGWNSVWSWSKREPTYVFFGEDPREAQVTRDLGFEKSVFPQISIQTVGSYSDLDVVQGQEGKGHRTGSDVTQEAGCPVAHKVDILKVGNPTLMHL